MNTNKNAALREVLSIFVDAIKAAGPMGIPSGHLYAALMGHGCSLNQYESIVGILVKNGRIKRSNHVLTAV